MYHYKVISEFYASDFNALLTFCINCEMIDTIKT